MFLESDAFLYGRGSYTSLGTLDTRRGYYNGLSTIYGATYNGCEGFCYIGGLEGGDRYYRVASVAT